MASSWFFLFTQLYLYCSLYFRICHTHLSARYFLFIVMVNSLFFLQRVKPLHTHTHTHTHIYIYTIYIYIYMYIKHFAVCQKYAQRYWICLYSLLLRRMFLHDHACATLSFKSTRTRSLPIHEICIQNYRRIYSLAAPLLLFCVAWCCQL